jgi:DNA polymerase III sliding clamp (beta) subunit (PCNA family)
MSKKFTINTKLLMRELAFITETIGGINPHLENVVLEAEGTHVTIIGGNGFNGATSFTTLVQPIEEKVSIALHGKKLYNIVRLIEEEAVTFSESDSKVTLTAGKGRYGFQKVIEAVAVVKVFIMPAATEGESYTVGAKQFLDALRIAEVFAATEEKTQFTMAGVRVDMDDKALYSRAMDGHRAVDATINDPCEARSGGVFLSSDSVALVMGIVDVHDKITITKTSNNLILKCGGRTAYVRRTVVENFPNISANLDKFMAENSNTATVDSQMLQGTVKRLQTAGEGKFRRIVFSVNDANLKLSSVDPMANTAEFEEEVTATTSGAALAALAANNILDFIKFIHGPVTFRLGGTPSHPVLITNDSGIRCMAAQMK